MKKISRYQRIKDIPNIKPFLYKNLTQLYLLGNRVWGYNCRADGSASYGDFKKAEWPNSVEKYLASLCGDVEETKELYFFVPYSCSSDYSGSTVEKANAKYIENSYENYDWVHPVYGDYNTYAVAIGVTGLLNCNEDAFDGLCETIENLEKYVVIDEDLLWELEMELTDEAWDSWAKDDFIRELEMEFSEVDFNWPDDLRTFFEEKREEAHEYWKCEGYGPSMHVRIDRVIEKIDFDNVEKWAIKYEVSWTNCGKETEIYYNEADALYHVHSLHTNGIIGAKMTLVS